MSKDSRGSYKQILRASSIIGGSAGINILLGALRSKIVAIVIGPAGIGLIGSYQSIQGVISTFFGLGIQSSAVRDIAEAAKRGDEKEIGGIVIALRRTCFVTGLMGASVTVIFSGVISYYTFGSEEFKFDIALLGIIVLVNNIQGGQMALVQGMRRIGDIARINVISGALGTIASISMYLWLGLRGIVPALVMFSLFHLFISWLYSRRIAFYQEKISWSDSLKISGGMIRLGIVFMWNGLAVAIVAYLTRALIAQGVGLEAVGIFTAAFAISGLFINFILSAMGADFYPRLTSLNDDFGAMRSLVNEQTEISLLLAVPGLLATLTFASLAIEIMYAEEFIPASVLLQWFVLGCAAKLISWPMGFIMLALAKSHLFFLTETALNIVHILLVWILLSVVGVEGVAIAYFLFYICHIVIGYWVSCYLIDFRWKSKTRNLLILLNSLVVVTFISSRLLPIWMGTLVGAFITLVSAIICFRGLVQRIGDDQRQVELILRIPGVRKLCGLYEVEQK